MGDWRKHLRRKPGVCQGQWYAAGPRIPVTVILDSLAEGSSIEEILRSYPSLRRKHLEAAPAYAAELAREESLLPLSRF